MKRYHIFKEPYILIEDTAGQLKPFHKEYPDQPPKLNLSSPPMHCPFTDKQITVPKKKRKNKVEFCEICYLRITDYDKHIIEPEHREYARDDANYENIDALISELDNCQRPVSPCDRFEVKDQRDFEEICREENVLYVDGTSGTGSGNLSSVEDVVDWIFNGNSK